MTEKHPSAFTNNSSRPVRWRGPLVAAGTLATAALSLLSAEATPPNFDPNPDHITDARVDVRLTPDSCKDSPTAVGIELDGTPRESYLGITAIGGSNIANGIHIKGTVKQVEIVPMYGLDRTVFAELIDINTVARFDFAGEPMVVEIGRGPDAINGERMMVAVGCSQEAIDKQQLFWPGQRLQVAPPMKTLEDLQ